MKEMRRGSNWALAWLSRGRVARILDDLKTAVGELDSQIKPFGAEDGTLSQGQLVRRARLIAEARDSANAATAAIAVEMVVDYGMSFNSAARSLDVSGAAVHGWVQTAAELDLKKKPS